MLRHCDLNDLESKWNRSQIVVVTCNRRVRVFTVLPPCECASKIPSSRLTLAVTTLFLSRLASRRRRTRLSREAVSSCRRGQSATGRRREVFAPATSSSASADDRTVPRCCFSCRRRRCHPVVVVHGLRLTRHRAAPQTRSRLPATRRLQRNAVFLPHSH